MYDKMYFWQPGFDKDNDERKLSHFSDLSATIKASENERKAKAREKQERCSKVKQLKKLNCDNNAEIVGMKN